MTATSSEHGGCCREFIDGKALETCVLWTSTVPKRIARLGTLLQKRGKDGAPHNNYFEGAKK